MGGSPIYDFLHESFLFDEARIETRYRDVSDVEFEGELARYRAHVDLALSDLDPGHAPAPHHVRLLAGTGAADLRILEQCAWYVSEFVVRDPLYEAAAQAPATQGPVDCFLGLRETSSEERRAEVVTAVRLLQAMIPMVAAGYVQVLPISRLFEPPAELPLTYSPTGFADALPGAVMEWFRQRADVLAVEVVDGRMVVFAPRGGMTPRRSIGVEFRPTRPPVGRALNGGRGESDPDALFVWQLMEQRTLHVDEERRIIQAINHMPKEPPTQAQFDAWVRQSIHQSARTFAGNVIREVALADRLKAHVLARSPLAAEFLSLASPAPGTADVAAHTANVMIDLELPFLNGVSIVDVMRVRQEDGEAFQAFREALEAHLRDLQHEDDPERARVRAAHVQHELATVQLGAVRRQVSAFRKKSFAHALLAAGSFATAVQTGGASLIAAAVAGASLYSAKAEYDASVKSNPAYFLWRVRQGRMRRGR